MHIHKIGLVTVCYRCIPWCTLNIQVREIIQSDMKFRAVKNKLYLVFKTSIKEFCPRVPKDVTD